LEKQKYFFLNFRIVAGSLPYKSRNLGVKISHGCREIAFCLVGYFNLSHLVYCIFWAEKSIFPEKVRQNAADPDQIRCTWTDQRVTTFREFLALSAHFGQNGG